MLKQKGDAPMHHNIIYHGDNIKIRDRVQAESIDLIYIDPPFNSGRIYETFWGEKHEERSFEDRYGGNEAYISWLRPRAEALSSLLKPTGSFFVHCDTHANYRVRMLMEDLGLHFQSEIVWKRISAHADSKKLGKVHDTIFHFSRTPDYYWNNDASYIPYDLNNLDEKTARIYSSIDEDGRRYTLGDLTSPQKNRPNLTYEFLGHHRVWRWTKARMEKAFKEGIVVQSSPGSVPRVKRFLDERKGRPLGDVWDDIPPVQGSSKERVGYPTQKPIALLQRIINLASKPNDLVLDAFCGCGTTITAAHALGRRWIGMDISPTAVKVMTDRLEDHLKLKKGIHFHTRTLEDDIEDLRKMEPYDFQNWAVIALGGVPGMKGPDGGIDGRIYPKSKSGKKGKQRLISFRSVDEGTWKQAMLFEQEEVVPVQIKQMDKVGRGEVDKFQSALRRVKSSFGVLVAFSFTSHAEREVRRIERDEGILIQLVTAQELLAA